MCGRADRPSAPLWQMKVILRRSEARRKAGNKQPGLWRTLKRRSERGKWRGRRREERACCEIEREWEEAILKPLQRGRSVTGQNSKQSFKCRAAQVWGLNLLPGIHSGSGTHIHTRRDIQSHMHWFEEAEWFDLQSAFFFFMSKNVLNSSYFLTAWMNKEGRHKLTRRWNVRGERRALSNAQRQRKKQWLHFLQVLVTGKMHTKHSGLHERTLRSAAVQI